ncbi:hypothetical protein [Amycolatopsis sp. PS_44_ISF1]|uniref:hypothetical protein n=1 Tax=Amycolatopsis sp. PS_44_ISF1 TaxID=2974917 RepID=UPI0028E024BE|nr:hypothetical protein [Amycolatopsis sp. PS_44_ISF1]MDT8913607.1 hypothetical protein [Amycolatopsis sp. PS_44_ISF1]
MADQKAFDSSLFIQGGQGAQSGTKLPAPDWAPDIGRAVADMVAACRRQEDAAWVGDIVWSFGVVDKTALRVFLTAPDGQVFGYDVAYVGDAEHALSEVAGGLQDFIVDGRQVGLPTVPGTERPAQASVVDGVASWYDAATEWKCQIGSYQSE